MYCVVTKGEEGKEAVLYLCSLPLKDAEKS